MSTFKEIPKATQPPKSAKSSSVGRAGAGQGHDPNSILHLRRTMENRAVPEEGNTASTGIASPHFGHDCARIPVSPRKADALQTKLAISKPGDEYEQEADRVADQVLTTPDSMLRRDRPGEDEGKVQTALLSRSVTPLISRLRPDEDEERRLQAKTLSEDAPSLKGGLEGRISNLRGGGQPLSGASRDYFEPRFGHDFSRVRVHTDDAAAGLARALNAQALALGQDVVFGPGQYAPEQDEGKRLLAHELTHVIQQNHLILSFLAKSSAANPVSRLKLSRVVAGRLPDRSLCPHHNGENVMDPRDPVDDRRRGNGVVPPPAGDRIGLGDLRRRSVAVAA